MKTYNQSDVIAALKGGHRIRKSKHSIIVESERCAAIGIMSEGLLAHLLKIDEIRETVYLPNFGDDHFYVKT